MPRLSTAQVAERLGVKPATVYAYVSRGLLSAERADDGRSSTFSEAEVERVAARGRRAHARGRAAAPVMSSAITLIDGTRHHYRGLDAIALAESGRSFEEVASWLWHGRFEVTLPWRCPADILQAAAAAQAALPPAAMPVDRLRVATVAASAADPLRYDVRPDAVTTIGRTLLACMVDALPLLGEAPPAEARLARRLWPRLTALAPDRRRVRLLETALVVMADHELPVSTVAVRLAASTGAHTYAAVSAGLGVIDGPLHGGASLGAERLLAEVAGGRDAAAAVGERLRRGERILGFGQPLYAAGDPRAELLLRLLEGVAGRRAMRPVRDLLGVTAARGLPAPNVELATAAVAHVLGMREGSGELLFAVARTAGWIGHALEEYAAPTRYRPRAVYVGPAVTPTTGA